MDSWARNPPDTDDGREREIGSGQRSGVAVIMFSMMFAVIILMFSSTPVGMYLGIAFFFVAVVVMLIWGMWNLATKADEFIGKRT